MNEKEFQQQVERLLSQRAKDSIHALDLGRCFKELCREYLKDHETLPRGFEGFEF